MKNKYRILKILVTVIILGFLLNFSLKRFSNQYLDKIQVKMIQEEAVSFIDEKDVREIVQRENPSKKVGSLDIPALERKISAHPVIDSTNVYMKLNGELNLDIVQRVPVFRLERMGKNFYVDKKGVEFPVFKTYSHPCMLVSGKVEQSEYPKLISLVERIEKDPFSRKFFVGISKVGQDYFLLTSSGDFRVEIGDLENIDFKIKGFKTFVEKYLIYQDPKEYSKISLKYDNQIVTTLRNGAKPVEILEK